MLTIKEQATVTSPMTAVPIGGIYRVTPPTYTDGQGVVTHYDNRGNLKVTLGTALSSATDSITAVLGGGSAAIGKVDHNYTGINQGRKTVTTAGTAERLVASSTPAKKVTIQAMEGNTQRIAVGGSGVLATSGATGVGICLLANESVTLECDDINDIFVDVRVNGEGVRFTYLT